MHFFKPLIPPSLFRALQPAYHYTLAFLGAVLYRFPSRRIAVIGVTGTKGKSTVTELINAILEEAGHTTAIASTIRFKIGTHTEPNLFKMTMPGRFFMQQFLRKAVSSKCRYAIIEMTSEGVAQFRHTHVDLDGLVFTNLAPEHIESHGSFENYLAAKLELAKALARSAKFRRIMISNADDPHGKEFFVPGITHAVPFGLHDAKPYVTDDTGIDFVFSGVRMHSPLRGLFNLSNILAAAALARELGIETHTICAAIQKLAYIPGRVEFIAKGQSFDVIVDYAHTPESQKALYEAFPNRRKICVLGNTGGGRDRWKRPTMGALADEYCSHVILTNEDPYDENPHTIVAEMVKGFTRKKPEILMDRREAIRQALSLGLQGDVVLITGKGTDPYIMEARGKKIPWSDARVAEEELNELLNRAPKKQ